MGRGLVGRGRTWYDAPAHPRRPQQPPRKINLAADTDRTLELVVLTIHRGRNATPSTLYTRTLLFSEEDYAELLEKDMWRLWLWLAG